MSYDLFEDDKDLELEAVDVITAVQAMRLENKIVLVDNTAYWTQGNIIIGLHMQENYYLPIANFVAVYADRELYIAA